MSIEDRTGSGSGSGSCLMLMVVEYVHSFDGFPDLNGLHGCDCLMRDGLLEATVFYDGTSTPFDPPGSTKLVSV